MSLGLKKQQQQKKSCLYCPAFDMVICVESTSHCMHIGGGVYMEGCIFVGMYKCMCMTVSGLVH